MARKTKVRRVYIKSKRGGRRRQGFELPLAIVAGFAPGAMSLWAHRSNGAEGIAAEASRIYLGYAGTNKFGYNDTLGFHPYLLKYGTIPIVAGLLIHKIVGGKLGVNRVLRQANIPFVRI